MRAVLTATMLCLALTGFFPVPAAAQGRPGAQTVILPHNMTREEALANEAYRHDFAVEHIRHNMRQIEHSHKRRLEDIEKDKRLAGNEKARRVADENQRFEIQMRGQRRQLAIAEQEHAKNEAEIRARYPEPGDRVQITADQFNAEGTLLDRAHAVSNEDIRYEGAVAHVDENRRAREESHRRRLKNIEDDKRLPADAKALERAEESGRFEVDLRKFERLRDLVEKEHQNQRAAIDARFGSPTPRSDVFVAQGDPTPPATPSPAPVDNSPIEGGVSGGVAGGKAATGPTGRPPRTGGTDQTGTGAVGQPQPGPVVLKGAVEENVNAPPVSEAEQQPCGKEWYFGTPDTEHQFVEGMTATVARCVEADWATMPVAGPAAYVLQKKRMVALVLTAATRTMGAASLYLHLQQQRPNGECAYDTGLWYGQLLCDARMLAARAPDDPEFGGGQRGGLDPIRPVRPPLRTGEVPPPRPASGPALPAPNTPEALPPGTTAPPTIQCVPLKDCFWRTMYNATNDPGFKAKFLEQPPKNWQEVHDTLKRYFAGKVPGVTSQNHANGIPERATYDQIVRDLESQEGAEAVAIAVYKNNESHAFNAANFKGYVVMIDDQKQFWSGNAPRQTVEQALKGQVAYWLYYRTK